MDVETKDRMQGAPKDRRQFIGQVAATFVAGLLTADTLSAQEPHSRIKAVAFDGFAIFDPRPVFALVEQLFPGKGAELSSQWRTRQFEYTWLHNSLGNYVDFWQVTKDALKYAAAQAKVDLSSAQIERLMAAYLELMPWPDVVPVLQELKKRQIRLALLSNLTPTMLEACVKKSQLEMFFDFQLSTDRVRVYKPDPRAYDMGLKAFEVRREEVAFAAFAGWDAAGAKCFGYPTYWANRLNAPAEELGALADMTSSDLKGLPSFIKAQTIS